MSDEWFEAICWSALLLEIFMIKWRVAFSLIVSDVLKQDCDIITRVMLSLLTN